MAREKSEHRFFPCFYWCVVFIALLIVNCDTTHCYCVMSHPMCDMTLDIVFQAAVIE